MKNNYLNLFKQYKKKYTINNLISKNNDYIFILESPHNDELKEKYPIAGDSGKDITKFLGISSNDSFGKLISTNSNKFNNISILNISTCPLQPTTHLDKCYINLLEKINSNIRCGYMYFGRHREDYINTIEELIFDDFKSAFSNLNLHTDTKLIVCGNFAQKYISLLDKSLFNIIDENNIYYVPHPSRHQWTSYKNDLDKIKDIFQGK